MKKRNPLSRQFDITTYLTEEQLKLVLEEKLSQIYRYAYIYHDKDDSVPHYHVYLNTKDAKSLSAVLGWFTKPKFKDVDGKDVNTRIRFEPTPLRAIRYLTHLDDTDKYQYSVDNVVAYGLDYVAEVSKPFIPKNEECVDSIATATLFLLENGLTSQNLTTCIKNYGRDFIMAYGNVKQLVHDIRDDSYRAHQRKRFETFPILDNETGEVVEMFDPTIQFKLKENLNE